MHAVQKLAGALFTAAMLFTAGVASAQTGTTSGTSTGTTTIPGVPNTGAGGDVSETGMILATSAIIVAFSIAALLMYVGYLTRRARRS